MSKLILIKPTMAYEEQIWSYRQAFLERGDSLDGTSRLKEAESVTWWLADVEQNRYEETVIEGFVPATSYLAVRASDNKVVGMIQVRHRLNDFLLNFGGHIGYSVHPNERKKGYATQMLRLTLPECRRELGLEKVLITCDKANVGSRKAIVTSGGILENEYEREGKTIQRYWVNV